MAAAVVRERGLRFLMHGLGETKGLQDGTYWNLLQACRALEAARVLGIHKLNWVRKT